MKKFLLPFVLAMCIAAYSTAQNAARRSEGNETSRFAEELNERDFDALRDYLKTKREIELQEKSTSLSISGDVRFEYRHLTEDWHGINLRGDKATTSMIPGVGRPISRNDHDVEFNLRFDYETECTWAMAQLQFDNSAGVDDCDISCHRTPCGWHGSGGCDDICLKRAYFGGRVYECGPSRLDVEIGRRNLYNCFDSRIQFLSRFDGLFMKYRSKCGCLGDWYWSFGAFVVDERVNQYAWVTEVGLINMYDYGIDFKYSFIDWVKNGKNRCFCRNPCGFYYAISQVSLAYHFNAEMLGVKGVLYGAYLINHLGHKACYIKASGRVKHAINKNTGWYIGFLLGEVEKEGDWSFEVRYEYVQAFAVPDEDASGICNGNVLNRSIYEKGAMGNTNYKGWRVEGLYALTDDITIDTQLEWSHAANTQIGGSHNYSKLEIEAIYAF